MGELDLPSGTVTFLFTDIEGSTKLAQQYSNEMPAMLARHHAILDQAIAAHNGFTFQIVGDSYAVAFHNATDALNAALDSQRALYQEAWSPAPINVRMGIHTGTAQLQPAGTFPRYDGYATIAMSQRIMSAGHGGQILLSQTSAALIGDKLPTGVRLVDMRERRLKDIAQPVHLYQASAPDLPSEFAPLVTLEQVNHNLPSELTPFVGRETELAQLYGLLSDPHQRLITLVAPGGMGKTRLSLEAAGQMVPAFPQGVYFVALDRINAADQIVRAVAEVLPISLSSEEEPKSRVMEYLSDKKVLLVMDNFEHVLEGATFVQELLRAAPLVQILASSRARLNVMGETVFHIEGLIVGDLSPEKNSAILLFASSASRLMPQFELDANVLPGVTRICRLVDGMPLAIVLAAAWIDTLSVDEIASEIETGIEILETEQRGVPDRQRSVRVVVESSWNQVDGVSQNLLKRLAVFRGGFTRGAAQEAAGASLRGLAQLVDKALLRRDPDTGRYSMHTLVRQYADEQLRLAPEEEQSAYEKHARYFADFMKTREVHLHDRRCSSALSEIDADLDNIRAAWEYWLRRQDGRHLLEFVSGLWLFYEVRGAFMPALHFFGDAANMLKGDEPDRVWARGQLRARQAWFTALIGQPEQGLQIAQASLDSLSQINQSAITVETYHCANINAIFLNQVELVIHISQQMLGRAEQSGDDWERGFALIWWSFALVLQRQIEQARQAGQEAAAIFERTGNPFGASVASGIILAAIALAIGDIRAAKAEFARGMQAAEEINYLRLLQRTFDGSGTAALLDGEVPQAQEFFIKSLTISQECGQTREMLASLLDLANVEIAQGKPAQALQLLAVVLVHPSSDQNSLNHPERLRDEAERLREKIATQLDPTQYQLAWEAGRRRPLAEVVTQILNKDRLASPVTVLTN